MTEFCLETNYPSAFQIDFILCHPCAAAAVRSSLSFPLGVPQDSSSKQLRSYQPNLVCKESKGEKKKKEEARNYKEV